MFDLHNAAFGIRERHPELQEPSTAFDHMDDALQSTSDYGDGNVFEDEPSGAPTPHVRPVDLELTPGRPRISLQDMISTSVALKSNLDVEILRPSSPWTASFFPTASSSPSKASISLPPEKDSSSLLQPDCVDQGQSQPLQSNLVQAISGLQREVLLLRNELNFELWLSRENVRHIGRLYQDQVLSKNAEAERQGLVRAYILLLLNCQLLNIPLSTISCGSIRRKLPDWKESLGTTRIKHFLRRTNMQIGTPSCRISFANSGRRRRCGKQNLLLCKVRRRMLRFVRIKLSAISHD